MSDSGHHAPNSFRHTYCGRTRVLLAVQVHFIVNNLSTANLPSKGGALKDLLPKEFWPWFANYMVVKRAAQVRPPCRRHPCMCSVGCSAAALQPPCEPYTPVVSALHPPR